MPNNTTTITDTIQGYVDQLREVESNLQQLSLTQQRLIGAISALRELDTPEVETEEEDDS